MKSDVHKKIIDRIARLGYPKIDSPSSTVVKTIDWLLEYLHPTYTEGPDHDGKWVLVVSNSSKALRQLAEALPPAYSLNFFKAIHNANTELLRRLSRDDYPDYLVPLGIGKLRNSGLILYENITQKAPVKLTYYEAFALGFFRGWDNPWVRVVITAKVKEWSSHAEELMMGEIEEILGDGVTTFIRENVETVKLMMEENRGSKFKVNKE
jgi:hypothetical protein